MKLVQAFATDYHDFTDYHLRNGATAFSSDMGSELQKPLSIAMIGTMSIGTTVSLFIIPLLYWFIYRNKKISIKY